MKSILQILQKSPAVDALYHNQERFANLTIAQEALLIATSYQKSPRSMVIVKPNLFQAQQLHEKIVALLNDEHHVFLLPQEDSLRVEAIAQSPELNAMKMEALMKILKLQNPLCITHTAAVIRKYPPKKVLQAMIMPITTQQIIQPDQLVKQLRIMGYIQTNRVDQPLTFAFRGGIIDIYSINYENPIRIELFDNEIESIRYFDLHTQRTLEIINQAEILFATDIIYDENAKNDIIHHVKGMLIKASQTKDETDYLELSEVIDQDLLYIQHHIKDSRLYRYQAFTTSNETILNYFNQPQVIVTPFEQVQNNFHHIMEETFEYIHEIVNEKKALGGYEPFYDFMSAVVPHKPLFIKQFHVENEISLHWHALSVLPQELSKTIATMYQESLTKVVVCICKENELKLVIEGLLQQNIPYRLHHDGTNLSQGITLFLADYDEGFVATQENLIVYTSKELFQKKVRLSRFNNRFKEAEILSNYQELKPNDYIVHAQYGIGKYITTVTQEIDGLHKDYLQIVYRGDDTLFVPLEQFRLIRKFVSSEGAVPKLNKLGTSEWAKTKQRIQANVEDIAERLIDLYSQRQQYIGHAYQPDNQTLIDFENEFEYELTEDQKTTISEIKYDMMQSKPMDRLLCGDVGFGKTEMAIRAAFKAVLENKQVAFLCPTTVLSHQHYQTFTQRFKDYPVNIAVLNRFVLESQQKKNIKDLKLGKIDILIGTHRILSKDIRFSDLGLLVIDEEQRFGVEHKEKIKEIRATVDVISLSATPIPRTLQMSLIGLRSLSQLNTPPSNRLPIQTYIVEKNQYLIKEVIERELSRKGQVFYLFNRVDQIYSLASKLQKDIPYARIAVAHGQMNREEIEDVMMKFTENLCDVLVCTTIIETGIDIPNANTMIIDNADTFGLSQLYQIKGRVGRSDRLAYAYLMYEPKKQLSEIAQKRLQAIKEFTELGSGYKIAMRDLTIRGAGDLLGPNQSGFIDTVGIDMYIELLQQAIARKQGKPIEIEEPPISKINMKVDAYIPKSFAPEDLEKINLYQRIDKVSSLPGLVELIDEISDNYGKLPNVVGMLFEKKRLEILVSESRIHSFKEHKEYVEIAFSQDYSEHIDGVELFSIVNRVSKDIQLRYTQKKILLKLPKHSKWMMDLTAVLIQTRKLRRKNEN